MAGEIQLNSTTMATESSGSITAELDTIRPNTTNGSLTLQGDSSDAGVTGLTIDSSGNATFAGTGNNIGTVIAGTLGSSVNIKASINASGSAPIYACRAWVNFNGTGTVAIRASGNVSSITDGGTGTYLVNYSTAMPDADYCTVASADNNSSGVTAMAKANSTSSGYVFTEDSFASTDCLVISYAVFR
jgi:hypothetical protein